MKYGRKEGECRAICEWQREVFEAEREVGKIQHKCHQNS